MTSTRLLGKLFYSLIHSILLFPISCHHGAVDARISHVECVYKNCPPLFPTGLGRFEEFRNVSSIYWVYMWSSQGIEEVIKRHKISKRHDWEIVSQRTTTDASAFFFCHH